jgi:hypothetical protein
VLFLIPKLHFFTKLVGASLTAKLFFPCMFSGSSPQKIADCFCVIFDFFLSSSYLFSPQFFSPLFLLDSLCHNHLLYNYGCLLNGPYSLLLLPSFHCPEYYPLPVLKGWILMSVNCRQSLLKHGPWVFIYSLGIGCIFKILL